MDSESRRLDEIGTIVTGTTPNSSLLHAGTKPGIPFLTPTDIQHRELSTVTERFLAKDAAEQFSTRLVPAGATAVTCIGASIGKTTMTKVVSLTNQQVNSVIPFPSYDQRFIYYSVLTVVDHFADIAGGSATPILNKSAFSEVRIPVVPIDRQISIASVLGALDDKIVANLTTVKKTNALAVALVGMRFPYASQTPLHELTSQISRGVAPKYDDSGKYLVLNQKCIRDSQIDIARARLMKSLPKSPGKILRQNDVLVNSTGQGTLGRIARWTSSDPNTSVDTHVSIVRFDPDVSDPAFAGTVLSTMERLVEDLAEGSTGQTELKRDLLGSLELSLPPLDVQREVGQQIELLDELCRTRIEENRVLAKTRDELLPLLMSGKISVKEAEQEAAAAGAEVQSEKNEA